MGKSDIFVGMNVLGDFVSYVLKIKDKFKIDSEIIKYAK